MSMISERRTIRDEDCKGEKLNNGFKYWSIMVFYLRNRGKRYFYDFSVRTLNLNTWCS